MKSIVKFSVIAVIAIAATFSSCGKYSDGPKISLKSKTARICREWVDANCSSSCDVTELKKDGSIVVNGTAWSGAKWAFSSDKKNLEMTYTFGSVSTTSSSEITRLTSKDLWLKDSGGTVTKNKAK